MILLSGYSGSGKTTIGKMLQQQNFWVVDTGKFWRDLRDLIAPGMNVGELHLAMREYTGDAHWEDNFLAGTLRITYERAESMKKDLVLIGYRTLEEALIVVNTIEGKVFPDCKTTIIYVEANFELTLERLRQREGGTFNTEDLRLRYTIDRARGVEKFSSVANYIITNNSDLIDLEKKIQQIISQDLRYDEVRREISDEKLNAVGLFAGRLIDHLTTERNLELSEGDLLRLYRIDRERK